MVVGGCGWVAVWLRVCGVVWIGMGHEDFLEKSSPLDKVFGVWYSRGVVKGSVWVG